jgi:hypothetical protein
MADPPLAYLLPTAFEASSRFIRAPVCRGRRSRCSGHWEGDLLAGSKNSHIGTLVERYSRFVMLIKLPNKDTTTVVTALSKPNCAISRSLYPVTTFPSWVTTVLLTETLNRANPSASRKPCTHLALIRRRVGLLSRVGPPTSYALPRHGIPKCSTAVRTPVIWARLTRASYFSSGVDRSDSTISNSFSC